MFTAERRHVIMATLRLNGSVAVMDLAGMMQCSAITVRRDLDALEAEGMLVRHRGGAVAKNAAMDEPRLSAKIGVAVAEKIAIAREAEQCISDGDVILLCGGTTTLALASRLVSRRLMVATNSLQVASVLSAARDVEVFVIGGLLRSGIRAMVGGQAEAVVRGMHFATVFLSGNGMTAQLGLSTPNQHVASMDRTAAAAADRVIVLADHTKVGTCSTTQTVPPERISMLITDAAADPREVAALRERGMDVRIAR